MPLANSNNLLGYWSATARPDCIYKRYFIVIVSKLPPVLYCVKTSPGSILWEEFYKCLAFCIFALSHELADHY